MKRMTLLIIGWCLIGQPSLSAQDVEEVLTMTEQVNKYEESISLEESLRFLENKYNVTLIYESHLVEDKVVPKRIIEEKDFQTALTELVRVLNLEYKQVGNRSFFLSTQEDFYRKVVVQETVTGTVTDAQSGETLPGVNVMVKGTTTGTSTDGEGGFELTVESLQDTLVFSFVGYQTQEVPINGRAEVNVELGGQAIMGEEMVVIGYGQQERSNITGAISSVSSDELSRGTSGGVQEALQGQIAGVNITPTSGQPGGALDMNVRGVSTFGNGNPLFVIDGVPLLSEGTSRNFNPLASLNPDNIESVEILKDASAAAIYGARAANGVVIITTKKGQTGPTQVQFKASRGVSTVIKHLPMMSTEQWIPYSSEAYENAGRPIPVAFQEPLLSENLQQNTDWQEEAFSPATIQNYWLGISGGNNNTTYSFSTGYMNQEGTLPNNGFKRYSARINTDFQISEKFTIGETIELSRSIWTGTFDQASYTMRQLLQQGPTVPVYNSNALGGFDGPRLRYGPVGRQNSIGRLTLDENQRTQNQVIGNAFAEYEFLSGLSYRLSVGGEVTFDNMFEFLPTFDMGDRVRNIATLNEGNRNENAYLIENTLTFQREFNDSHNLTILAGFTQHQSWAKGVDVQVRDFPNNDLRTVGAAFEERTIDGNETGWTLRSQIGRLNYTYNDTYNLMLTVRRDGSSRFGRNNQYGIFPSVSGSWIITNESFMDKFDAFSNFTLRASWGKVGSQDIHNFAQYATIEQGEDYIYGEGQELIPGSTYLSLGNPDLKWEITTQTNVGFDIGLFDNRLSFVMNYYIKDTDDILLQLPIPTTSGFGRNNGAFVNAGSMRNQGIEFTANYQNNIGDFNYNLSGNISTNKNEVTFLEGGQPIIVEARSGKQSSLTFTQEGSEIGSFYGYVMEGIFRDQADLDNHATQSGSAPGDVKFRDLNNDGIINADDQTIIGSPFPDFTYGFNVNFLYKQFDMTVSLHGKQGHDLYNHVWADLNEGEGDNNVTTEMLDRWTPDNRDTNIPRAVTGNPGQNTRPSTRFVEDASFLRIQNVQLGYNLAPELVDRLNISGLRVYISAKNLFTFTDYRGYNPEIGLRDSGSRSSLTRGIDHAMYPIPRTIEAGFQIDFN